MNFTRLMASAMLAVVLAGGAPLGALASGPGSANPDGLGSSVVASVQQEAGDGARAGDDQMAVTPAPGVASVDDDAVHNAESPAETHSEVGAEGGATLEGAVPPAGYQMEASQELGLGPWLVQFSAPTVERAYQAALAIARDDMTLAAMLAAAVAVLAASSGTALLIAAKAATGSSLDKKTAKKTMVTKRRKLDVGI